MKRPFLYCAISFCFGILIGDTSKMGCVPNSIAHLIALSAVSIILAAALFKKNIISHILLYLALIFFGAAYYQNYNTLPDGHISNFISEENPKAVVRGIVIDDPFTKKAFYGKKKTSFTLRVSAIGGNPSGSWRAASGLVKTDLYSDEKPGNLGFGDEVVVEGRLSGPAGLKNPGLFDYSKYLGLKNIYAVLAANGMGSVKVIKGPLRRPVQRWAYLVRHRIRDSIERCVGSPYSGFLKAILIGDRTELEAAITDDFVKTGTVHVLAISGLHVGLVAAIFLFIFKLLRIPKKARFISTAVILVIYSFVAGSNPPVIRATIIFVIIVLGYIVNRDAEILNSLSIAAFGILLWNPKELFDPSFQLSFASVLSIILFAPKIESVFAEKNNYLTKSVSVSIAATVGVLPIVAKYFNIVSAAAIIANLVVIPALFVIVAGSFLFLFLYLTGLSAVAVYAGTLLSAFIKLTFIANGLISRLPMAYFRVRAPSTLFLTLYYAALFWLFFLSRKKDLLIPLLLIANIITWSGGPRPANGPLEITFLDVGKGDSALLEFPNKRTMLIDAGSGGVDEAFDIGKNVVAPYLWNKGITRLDVLVITHFHEDHAGGALYILKNFDVGCVMDNGVVPQEERRLYDEYKKIVFQRGIRRLVIADGDEITGFPAARLYVMNPSRDQSFSDPNNSSLVIKLEYEKFAAIFTGDISSDAMERVMNYGGLLKSDLLKMPHHGGSIGKRSTAAKFFAQVSPEVSVTSSGGRYRRAGKKDDRHGLKSSNLDTRVNGAIAIIVSGDGFKAEPFYQKN